MSLALAVRERPYGGWSNCLELSQGIVDLVTTVDVGPRIIRFGFVGERNELLEIPDERGLTGGDRFRAYGGHRMWHAPEAAPRTYLADNEPVCWQTIPGGVVLRPPQEAWTHIRKEMAITMAPDRPQARIVHRMTNNGAWPVELAIWAITLMAPGGVQILPQSREDSGLLPNRMVCLWPYTRMDDSRVTWGGRYIRIRQDSANKERFKIGISNTAGWAAYVNQGHMLVKHFAHVSGATYPDYAASYEAFTAHSIMEMETLSPLRKLNPGETVAHCETWALYDGIETPTSDAAIHALELLIIRDREG